MGHKTFNRSSGSRKPRKVNTLNQSFGNWLLVCEGVETEPNYFRGVVNYYKEKLPSNYKLKIDIKGVGMNTVSLVNYTNNILREVRKNDVLYEKTFVVFDKDSFREFDEAIEMCKDYGYISLWSNEAIEYWFLLHFNKIEGVIDRSVYEKKLNEYFKKNGANYKYKKNDKDIFNKLCTYGNLELARNYAKEIANKWKDETPSRCCSCTTVYKFFDELDEMLKDFI